MMEGGQMSNTKFITITHSRQLTSYGYISASSQNTYGSEDMKTTKHRQYRSMFQDRAGSGFENKDLDPSQEIQANCELPEPY